MLLSTLVFNIITPSHRQSALGVNYRSASCVCPGRGSSRAGAFGCCCSCSSKRLGGHPGNQKRPWSKSASPRSAAVPGPPSVKKALLARGTPRSSPRGTARRRGRARATISDRGGSSGTAFCRSRSGVLEFDQQPATRRHVERCAGACAQGRARQPEVASFHTCRASRICRGAGLEAVGCGTQGTAASPEPPLAYTVEADAGCRVHWMVDRMAVRHVALCLAPCAWAGHIPG